MKRLAILIVLSTVAACGGDDIHMAPGNSFTGTWSGFAIENMGKDTLYLSLTSAQSGDSISGTGTAMEKGSTAPFTFTGISTPPTVDIVIPLNVSTLMFAGTYIRGDSVAGTVSNGSVSLDLGLKRQ